MARCSHSHYHHCNCGEHSKAQTIFYDSHSLPSIINDTLFLLHMKNLRFRHEMIHLRLHKLWQKRVRFQVSRLQILGFFPARIHPHTLCPAVVGWIVSRSWANVSVLLSFIGLSGHISEDYQERLLISPRLGWRTENNPNRLGYSPEAQMVTLYRFNRNTWTRLCPDVCHALLCISMFHVVPLPRMPFHPRPHSQDMFFIL